MPLVLRNALALGFAALLLGVIADAAIGHRNIAELVETNREVSRSRDVQDALERLLFTVTDAETGQRGYIITGKESYLAPYQQAVADVHKRLERVQSLTRELPNHQERLARVTDLTGKKLDEMAETIRVFRSGPRGKDEAIDIILNGHGKEHMDQLREQIGAMQSEEAQLLNGREQSAAASLRQATVMNIVGGAVGIALVLLAFFLFQRDLRARDRAASDLRRANDQLEERVARRTDALKRSADELSVEVRERRLAEEALRSSQEELERRVAERTAELRAA
ncbi:MAG TPA: CHASE3 domain-containing protein, partial [Gemmataceae bacterium]|nr:CHASE3 domain-containing protein [Gemmataceae bacterium]